ncbi:unnamed protein product [Owenia fusiformis]|uniref:Major facilitator superfamily domain-containing protein 4A n=1 Tax=Owenia fusiformis TaxID=6347 RepID=A0A8J1T7L5_OWEFU|nr:unnamed protein product [Owenia fusiformis]
MTSENIKLNGTNYGNPYTNETETPLPESEDFNSTATELNHQCQGIAGTIADDNTPTSTLSGALFTFWRLFKQNAHATLSYCMVFWSFGMCVAFLGPTLLDLGCQTSTDDKTMSWVFFFQAVMTLVGSILGGFMVKFFPPNGIILTAISVLPMTLFIVPFCNVMAALGVVLAVMGINMGMIDSLANLQMLKIYGPDVAPFIQALHFFYGLGAFVSPMIAQPFLLNEDCSPYVLALGNNSNSNISTSENHSVQILDGDLESAQDETHVRYAFWIMAAVQLPIPVLVFSLYLRDRGDGKPPEDSRDVAAKTNKTSNHSNQPKHKNEYQDIDDSKQKEPLLGLCNDIKDAVLSTSCTPSNILETGTTTTTKVLFVALFAGILMFLYDGVQGSFGGYVYSYAVKSVEDMDKTEGAYLNACFWGSFALGRLLSIPLAAIFTPAFMLACNIFGCTGFMVLMLALRHNHIALYIGSFFFGIFLSSIVPTTLALAELLIDMTYTPIGIKRMLRNMGLDGECGATITTFVVVMAATGEVVFPVVTGNLFAAFGPLSFLIFCLSICVASIGVYVCLMLMGRTAPKFQATFSGSFIWSRPWSCQNKSGSIIPKRIKFYSRMEEDSSEYEMESPVHDNAKKTPAPDTNLR